MAVSGHLQLILLVPVLSLCGATEYYVRPTESTNTSCPAQPCLTLNQYVNDSDRYFKSNTVFKFLPGTHRIDRPVTFENVHNVSLKSFSSERPHLMTQFSCETEVHDCIPVSAYIYDFDVCCAAICLHDVHNVTLRGIVVTLQTQNISGIILTNVSNLSVQLTTIYSSYPYYCLGIAVYDSDSLEVQSSSANNCACGLVLCGTNNAYVKDVTATYNTRGVVFLRANDSSITNTIVMNNREEGMYLEMTNNTQITNTTATYSYIGIVLLNMTNTHITNTTAAHNDWMGISLYSMINTHITKVIATHNNKIKFVDAVGEITIVISTHTLIYNTSFTDIKNASIVSTKGPSKLPAVLALYGSSVHISGCEFTRNHISAIGGVASNITLSGNLTFSNNRALAGTAFILAKDSVLYFAENSKISFLNNYSINSGGIFYIFTNIKYNHTTWFQTTTCFLHIEGSRFQTKLTFVNNSAGMGGDILYGGQVALGLDGGWNCLDSFKFIANITQRGLSSLISSDPSRVCLCNKSGQPDCLILADPTPRSIYPGQSINISAVVVGQDFGTVAGSVYAQFLQISPTMNPPWLLSWQKIQSVQQQKCNNLSYTILPQSDIIFLAVLVLTAQDSYVSQYNVTNLEEPPFWKSLYNTSDVKPLIYGDNPVYVNISFLPCPPGFMLTPHPPFRCDCNLLLQQMNEIQCHIQDQTIGRSGQLWVGMIHDGNGTNRTVAASKYCSLNYCNQEESNVILSQPDSQCNFNHSGTLCGGCQPGLSLALGSAQCLPCSNKYLGLLIPLTIAGPVLVGIIKLLDLTISQGTMNGLIFYANIVKGHEYIFLPREQTNPLTLFIAWINLDLGVETCLFNGLSAYSKTWLQFVFPLYIWSIAGLIIILAKYSDRAAKMMGNNSVPVLATLFLLSYAKIFRTIITALSYTIVYSSQNATVYSSHVWTADGNVDYLGPKHALLFTVAVGTLLFLWLPYTLLLFLGQWLHMCNCRLISHILMKIKPFLDAHYGPLKGKHRYWFGALLLVRAVILLIQALLPASCISTVVLCILVCSIVLTHYGQLVYCNLAVSVFDTAYFMNLALLSGATAVGEDPTLAAYVLIGVAFVQFAGLIIFKVLSILKQKEKVMSCLNKGRPVEEDWEVYEQAALLRQTESDTEQQDSEGSESTENLPTY